MKKLLLFLPAILHTAATLCLNLISGALIPLWHLWNLLFWLSGWLMGRGLAWGCIPGLLPGAMILLLKRGMPPGVETAAALAWTVYYLALGLSIRRHGKRMRKKRDSE